MIPPANKDWSAKYGMGFRSVQMSVFFSKGTDKTGLVTAGAFEKTSGISDDSPISATPDICSSIEGRVVIDIEDHQQIDVTEH